MGAQLVGTAATHRRVHGTAVAIGLALGVFSVLADGVLRWRALTTLGNIISPWVVVAFVAGRVARSPRAGGWAGLQALAVGVVSYYFLQGLRFTSGDAPYSLLHATHLVWLVAAVVVGPAVGAAGGASARLRPPMLAVVGPAAILTAEAMYLVMDRQPWRWNLSKEPHRLADIGVFLALLGLALSLPALLTEDRGRRRRAYGALAICATAGAIGIRLLYRTITAVA